MSSTQTLQEAIPTESCGCFSRSLAWLLYRAHWALAAELTAAAIQRTGKLVEEHRVLGHERHGLVVGACCHAPLLGARGVVAEQHARRDAIRGI